MPRLLFFGPLGDVMGRARTIALPEGVESAGALLDHLAAADPAFAEAASRMRLRVAVNEAIVDLSAPIGATVEIAFLPPFSGG
ncbi:MAG: MoaD/ThiS family protein [Amphiplicatus sp.]